MFGVAGFVVACGMFAGAVHARRRAIMRLQEESQNAPLDVASALSSSSSKHLPKSISSDSTKSTDYSSRIVIVLYNPSSGGHKAAGIAKGLQAVLGANVELIPLSPDGIKRCVARLLLVLGISVAARTRTEPPETPKDAVPSLLAEAAKSQVRLVVCGGDGSVAWAIDALGKAGLSHSVPVGIIPVGTGNDMANHLGWGSHCSAMPGIPGATWWKRTAGVLKWWDAIHRSFPQASDVWKVEAHVDSAAGGKVLKVQNGVESAMAGAKLSAMMMNYMSCGNDARLVYEVETRRFGARWMNRVLYAVVGLVNCLRLSPPVTKFLDKVVADKHRLPIQESVGSCAGLLVLNVGRYGGGAPLWQLARQAGGKDHPMRALSTDPAGSCSSYDGKLDIIGARTLFQLGTSVSSHYNMIGGVVKLAQASELELEFDRKTAKEDVHVYLQVDGEGFLLINPVSIAVKRSRTTLLLGNEAP